jgi:hypothetical protein
MLCHWASSSQNFRRLQGFHLPGHAVTRRWHNLTMKAICCCQTSGTTCPMTHCHIPEDWNLDIMRLISLAHSEQDTGHPCHSLKKGIHAVQKPINKLAHHLTQIEVQQLHHKNLAFVSYLTHVLWWISKTRAVTFPPKHSNRRNTSAEQQLSAATEHYLKTKHGITFNKTDKTNIHTFTRFEGLTVVLVTTRIQTSLSPCCMSNSFRRFEVLQCRHLQGHDYRSTGSPPSWAINYPQQPTYITPYIFPHGYFSWTAWTWRWYNPSKCCQLLARWLTVTPWRPEASSTLPIRAWSQCCWPIQ